MQKKLERLKQRLQEINDINSAVSVLSWDQSTYMPPGGAPARGRQMATLSRIAHEMFTEPEMGQLLAELSSYAEKHEDDDASLIRVTIKDYEQATKIPSELLAEFNQHITESYQVWMKARP